MKSPVYVLCLIIGVIFLSSCTITGNTVNEGGSESSSVFACQGGTVFSSALNICVPSCPAGSSFDVATGLCQPNTSPDSQAEGTIPVNTGPPRSLPSGAVCDRDSDCPASFICVNSACSPSSQGQSCAEDSDCNPGYLCSNYACLLGCSITDECVAALGANYVCSGGVCGQSLTANICPPGYIWDQATQSCIVGGGGTTTCTPLDPPSPNCECVGGSFLDPSNQCVCDASNGESWNVQSNQCMQGGQGQYCPDPHAIFPGCTTCQPGFTYSTVLGICELNNQLNCQPPTTNVNGQCLCPNALPPGPSGCACGTNEVQTASGGCACVVGFHTSPVGCVPDCPLGYVPDPTNAAICILSVSCPTGYHPDPQNPNACIPDVNTGCPTCGQVLCADGSTPGPDGCPTVITNIALCNADRDCPSNHVCKTNVCTRASAISLVRIQQQEQGRVTVCPFCHGETDGFGNTCIEGEHPSCPSVQTLSTRGTGSEMGTSDGSLDVGVSRDGTVNELPANVQELEEVKAKTLVATAGSYLDNFLEKVLVIDKRTGTNQYFVASQSKIGKAMQKK